MSFSNFLKFNLLPNSNPDNSKTENYLNWRDLGKEEVSTFYKWITLYFMTYMNKRNFYFMSVSKILYRIYDKLSFYRIYSYGAKQRKVK